MSKYFQSTGRIDLWFTRVIAYGDGTMNGSPLPEGFHFFYRKDYFKISTIALGWWLADVCYIHC
jgi:hypothetical protein